MSTPNLVKIMAQKIQFWSETTFKGVQTLSSLLQGFYFVHMSSVPVPAPPHFCACPLASPLAPLVLPLFLSGDSVFWGHPSLSLNQPQESFPPAPSPTVQQTQVCPPEVETQRTLGGQCHLRPFSRWRRRKKAGGVNLSHSIARERLFLNNQWERTES